MCAHRYVNACVLVMIMVDVHKTFCICIPVSLQKRPRTQYQNMSPHPHVLMNTGCDRYLSSLCVVVGDMVWLVMIAVATMAINLTCNVF